MQKSSVKGEWLTTDGAARKLRVDPRTVRRYAEARVLPASGTRNGFWLFREADVDRLVLKRAQLAGRTRAELVALVPPARGAGAPPRQASFRIVRKSVSACPRSGTKAAGMRGDPAWVR